MLQALHYIAVCKAQMGNIKGGVSAMRKVMKSHSADELGSAFFLSMGIMIMELWENGGRQEVLCSRNALFIILSTRYLAVARTFFFCF